MNRSQEQATEISRLLDLPFGAGMSDALAPVRGKAVELFEKLSWPDRSEEDWRFTSWQRLVPPDLGGEAAEVSPTLVPDVRPGMILPDPSLVAFRGGFGLYATSEIPGLKFESLGAPETVRPEASGWLENLVERSRDRFDALTLATFSDAIILTIADRAQLRSPIVLEQRLDSSARQWQSSVSRISFGENSSGTLVILTNSEGFEVPTFGSDYLEMLFGRGAEWTVVFVQAFDQSVRRLQRVRAVFDSDARAVIYRLDVGGAVVRSEAILRLHGGGAEALFRGAYLLGDGQHLEVDTVQDHSAPGDHSDLLVKGVLGGSAKAVYRGRIWIRKGAQRSNAYQANRNVLLSSSARAHSIPMLDIEANDVRCTHGSATGPVDPNQMFYLQSRGIPKREARRLIVEGFAGEVFRGISPDRLHVAVEEAIQRKLDLIL